MSISIRASEQPARAASQPASQPAGGSSKNSCSQFCWCFCAEPSRKIFAFAINSFSVSGDPLRARASCKVRWHYAAGEASLLSRFESRTTDAVTCSTLVYSPLYSLLSHIKNSPRLRGKERRPSPPQPPALWFAIKKEFLSKSFAISFSPPRAWLPRKIKKIKFIFNFRK